MSMRWLRGRSDAQAALEERGAGLAELEDEADGVVEEVVVLLAGFAVGGGVGVILLGAFEEAVDVLGLALRLPECGDGADLLLRNKRRVDALHAAGAGGR